MFSAFFLGCYYLLPFPATLMIKIGNVKKKKIATLRHPPSLPPVQDSGPTMPLLGIVDYLLIADQLISHG